MKILNGKKKTVALARPHADNCLYSGKVYEIEGWLAGSRQQAKLTETTDGHK